MVFQNGPSAFTGLGYTSPMFNFGNAIVGKQHRNFLEVRKPRTVVRWTVKELFANPAGSETCGFIHVVQGPRSPNISGAALPPSGHAESDVDGNHGHTEGPRHNGMARLVAAQPALFLGHGAPAHSDANVLFDPKRTSGLSINVCLRQERTVALQGVDIRYLENSFLA